ncbi:hypothetical protein ACFXTH_022895 [Malus domestica]
MVLQGTLQWQRKPKCYAIALRKPTAITQAVSCTARRHHHQERIVTKRHYAVKPRCRLLHSTTRQRATEGNCGQKALNSEISLQSLTQAYPRPATTALKASRRSWRQALPSQD